MNLIRKIDGVNLCISPAACVGLIYILNLKGKVKWSAK